MNKYNNGKIYKVINDVSDKIYIGSTIRKLNERFLNHKANSRNEKKQSIFYNYIREIGILHFKIILIKNCECYSKEELEKEEFNCISECDPKILLNDSLLYKKRSTSHINKCRELQKGRKSILWKYGSVFKRQGKRDGYVIDAWCFTYRDETIDKQKTLQFSIKKFGDKDAQKMAENARKNIYPNC